VIYVNDQTQFACRQAIVLNYNTFTFALCATGSLSEYVWFETPRPPSVPLILKALLSDIYCYRKVSLAILDFSVSLHFGIPLFDMRCLKAVFDMKIVRSVIRAVTTVRKVNIYIVRKPEHYVPRKLLHP
jgi:hypothetical protein